MVNKFNLPSSLPISKIKNEIVETIQNYQVIIIAGETGSGKTTQLPKLCLMAGLGNKKMIGCTQPRRIAASSVSNRVAEELGELSDIVGYKIRFSDQTSKNTVIKFLTDGMLLAEAANDTNLSRYDTIILDEAHERNLNIDFLLGILKILIKRRKDLKIIISSATLDTERFSKFFNNAPILKIKGKTYPVTVHYKTYSLDENNNQPTYVELAIEGIKDILSNYPSGDILVFMPTERDIKEVCESLNKLIHFEKSLVKVQQKAIILPLYGRLSIKDQRKIFKSYKNNKIVVTTNVAETSITVPGIRYVIDTGVARISSYNPRAKTTKLPIRKISQASADQRKGRCGRIGPGVCLRLFSEEDFQSRDLYTAPEIVRSNLSDVILRMSNLRLGHPSKFPFIDPPNKRSIKDGFNLLSELGALKTSNNKSEIKLSKRGRLMAKLPLDPCVSRMILEAKDRGVVNEVIVIASALSIQDPRMRVVGKEKLADEAHQKFNHESSDFLSFIKIWNQYHHVAKEVKSRSKLRKFCKQNYLSYQRMREWNDIYEQICKTISHKTNFSIMASPLNSDSIHQSILTGVLRNIGLKKQKKRIKESMIKK